MSSGRVQWTLLAVFVIARLEISAATFTVNSATDVNDGACDAAHCSLREAILAANSTPGADTVTFSIDTGVQRITVTGSTFPPITDSVTIDGWSQPGYVPSAILPVIELRATSVADNLLTVSGNSQSTTIRGLSMNTCATAITVTGPVASITLRGNAIGYNTSGAPTDLSGDGIRMTGAVSAIRIGGPATADRNSIGMATDGIDLQASAPSDILIEGNRLGLGNNVMGAPNVVSIRMASAGAGGVIRDNIIAGGSQMGLFVAAGAGPVLVEDNSIEFNFNGAGMRVIDAPGTVIRSNRFRSNTLTAVDINSGGVTFGGSGSGDGNLVSDNSANGVVVLGSGTGTVIQGNTFDDNGGSGVSIQGAAVTIVDNVITGNSGSGIVINPTALPGTVIRGNRIGRTASGSPSPNGGDGASVWASGTTVGGTGAGDANEIAYNNGAGVGVLGVGVTGVRIEGNSIHSNGTVGIDLSNGFSRGATPNDPGDADTSIGNRGQNYPLLDSATAAGSLLTVRGSLDSEASRTYRVCVYGYSSVQHISHVQGRDFIGCTSVATNSGGDGTFTWTGTVPSNAVYASATATSDAGDTSEFSIGVPIVHVGTLSLSTASPSVPEGGTATVIVTRSGGSSGAISATVATLSGTATTMSDFAGTNTVVTFGDGDTSSKSVMIPLANDAVDEANESFTVTLSNPAGDTTIGPVHEVTVTIVDDDPPPTLSIDDVAVTEGQGGVVEATFTVTKSGATEQVVTVNFATANGTATAPGDYSPAGGVLTFAPGVTTRTVTVNVSGDTIVESSETFLVVLSSPVNAALADAQGAGAINDDDSAPTLSVQDVRVTEGGGGTTDAVFTLQLSASSAQTITVDYATAGGTAIAGADYIQSTSTVTFAPDVTVQTVRVPILGDTVDEPDESFALILANPVNVTLGDAEAEGVIEDDDPLPQISIANASLVEGNDGGAMLLFPVTLSNASSETVSVRHSTFDGTAVAGTDYIADTASTLTIPAGTTAASISVQVKGDTITEANETFMVVLSEPLNGGLAGDRAEGTIVDDDGTPQIMIGAVSVAEGDSATSTVAVPLTLSHPSSEIVTVRFATEDDTALAGGDYLDTNGSVSFAAGETTKTIAVDIAGDVFAEPVESFRVVLSDATGAAIGGPVAVVTIVDDDGTPTASTNDVAVVEGDGGIAEAVFTVTLSVASAEPVAIEYATADRSATAGTDYVATSGTLTFAPGTTSKPLVVQVLGDTTVEPDETFVLDLTTTGRVRIADGQVVATIPDDDAMPLLTVTTAGAIEGNTGTSGLLFTASLSAPSARTITVDYATANVTATGADYVTTQGTLTFAPNVTSQSVIVPVIGDTIDEPDETFLLTLSNPVRVAIADAAIDAVIHDDDEPPVIAIGDVVVVETNGGTTAAQFPVTLSNASSEPVRLIWSTVDGTALAASDYIAQSAQELTIAAGATTASIAVAVVGDVIAEANEMFAVLVADASNASIADDRGEAMIVDDDGLPQLVIRDLTVPEGNAGTTEARVEVSLSHASSESVTVQFATQDGTAQAGADFDGTAGTLTFAAGETAKTITVAIVGDVFAEPVESLVVTLADASGATIADAVAGVTIVDDDGTPAASISDVAVVEGNDGTTDALLTVTLSVASTTAVVLAYETADESGTAPVDYIAASGSLTFDPGVTSKTIAVTVRGDTAVEPDEGLVVILTSAVGATIADPEARVIIANDDSAPRWPGVFAGNTALVEGDGGANHASFSILLSGGSSMPVSVDYATADGTARAETDYRSRAGTLTFAPGTTLMTVTVPVLGDRSVEPTETFTLHLANPVNATLAAGVAVATIVNDDVPGAPNPEPPLALSRISLEPTGPVTECTAGTGIDALFTIRAQPAPAVPVAVKFATRNGTAQAGADYDEASGELILLPGQRSATIPVRVACDSIDEPAEAFFLLLEETSSGGALAAPIATATIIDDDEAQQRTRAIIAVIGATPGMHGSFFRSTLRLLNPTDLPIRGRIVLHAAGRPAADGDPDVPYALQPHESRLYDDIMAEAGLEGLVSAEILADAGEVPVVYVRVFNDAGPAGTTGFVEEELAPEDALRSGDRAVLFAPADLRAHRFNVGVRSLDQGASFEVEVRDEQGAVRSRISRTLPPETLVHMTGTELAGTALGDRDVIFIAVTAGDLIAYGATTDNITNDPSVQFARRIR